MLNADERVALVTTRVRARRRASAKRSIAVLSSSCAVLLVCLVALVGSFAQPGVGDVVGLYGASILFSKAGSYVLVALISFVAAVGITLGCISYRHNSERRVRGVGEEKDVDHV